MQDHVTTSNLTKSDWHPTTEEKRRSTRLALSFGMHFKEQLAMPDV